MNWALTDFLRQQLHCLQQPCYGVKVATNNTLNSASRNSLILRKTSRAVAGQSSPDLDKCGQQKTSPTPRRLFPQSLLGAAAISADPERLLWTPGRKTISIPRPQPIAEFTEIFSPGGIYIFNGTDWRRLAWVRSIRYLGKDPKRAGEIVFLPEISR